MAQLSAQENDFRMLRSLRTPHVPPLEVNETPYIGFHGQERAKMYDIEALKTLILEKYNASVDIFNLGQLHYHRGQLSERLSYRYVKIRRTSFSNLEILNGEKPSPFFLCGLNNMTRVKPTQRKYYRQELEKLFPPLKRPGPKISSLSSDL